MFHALCALATAYMQAPLHHAMRSWLGLPGPWEDHPQRVLFLHISGSLVAANAGMLAGVQPISPMPVHAGTHVHEPHLAPLEPFRGQAHKGRFPLEVLLEAAGMRAHPSCQWCWTPCTCSDATGSQRYPADTAQEVTWHHMANTTPRTPFGLQFQCDLGAALTQHLRSGTLAAPLGLELTTSWQREPRQP